MQKASILLSLISRLTGRRLETLGVLPSSAPITHLRCNARHVMDGDTGLFVEAERPAEKMLGVRLASVSGRCLLCGRTDPDFCVRSFES